MMNILVFCQYYYPESVGPMLMCENMVNNGNNVKVITGLPDYNTGYVDKSYKFIKNRKQIINGVKVERTFEIGRRKGKVWLSLNYLSYLFAASLKALFLSNEYDIVYCYQLSPITMAIPAILYSKLKNKKIILYCLDLWPESLKVMGISENSIVYKLLDKISKFVYSHVDKIAVSSKDFKEYINKRHHVDISKIEYIPQASIDYGTNESDRKNKDYDKEGEITNFVYAGNCGFAQNIECILNAVKLLKENYPNLKKYKVHIAGTGANLNNLKNYVKTNNLTDLIYFYGQLQQDELMKLYKKADATLVTLSNDNKIGTTLPLKVISYMSIGKPILASLSGSAAEIIKNHELGVVVEPNDYKSLCDVMKDFIENKDKYCYMGKNARKYYESEYTIDVFMKRINKCRDSILGGN